MFRFLTFARFGLAVFVLITVGCSGVDNSKPSDSLVESAIHERLNAELVERGRANLLSSAKVDGLSVSEHEYHAYFRATFEVTKTCIYVAPRKDYLLGFVYDLPPCSPAPGETESRYINSRTTTVYGKGLVIDAVGTATFVKKESGWDLQRIFLDDDVTGK